MLAFSISSMCSLNAYTRALFTDDVDPLAIGAELMSGYWPVALERARTYGVLDATAWLRLTRCG